MRVTLIIHRWDTAGADRFKGVTTAYFRGAHGKDRVISRMGIKIGYG